MPRLDQAMGDHAAGRPRTDNDVIDDVFVQRLSPAFFCPHLDLCSDGSLGCSKDERCKSSRSWRSCALDQSKVRRGAIQCVVGECVGRCGSSAEMSCGYQLSWWWSSSLVEPRPWPLSIELGWLPGSSESRATTRVTRRSLDGARGRACNALHRALDACFLLARVREWPVAEHTTIGPSAAHSAAMAADDCVVGCFACRHRQHRHRVCGPPDRTVILRSGFKRRFEV